MTPTTEVMKQADEVSEILDRIRSGLDDEERQHLALELLDATREGEHRYGTVIRSWALTVRVRERPEYEVQVKEFRNLETSGELFAGTPLAGALTGGTFPAVA